MKSPSSCPTPLSHAEITSFHDSGFLLLEQAICGDMLQALRADYASWLEQSRCHSTSFGQQIDGRPRFSLEPSHHNESPPLRRIASPIELSQAYLSVMRNCKAVDAVAQLIGPNIKFNNSKVNSKHPGSNTQVKYHQDFPFEPHSNQSLIAVLIFIDKVTPDNGPLEVVPGSHKGPFFSLWHDNKFTGAVSEKVELGARKRAIPCYGQAGSACLMHTRLLHGSAPNHSNAPRTLYINTYCAEDAIPLAANHIPSKFEGEIVRGQRTNLVRFSEYQMPMPEKPKEASFFEQQAGPADKAQSKR